MPQDFEIRLGSRDVAVLDSFTQALARSRSQRNALDSGGCGE
jgi:hypothetical protein